MAFFAMDETLRCMRGPLLSHNPFQRRSQLDESISNARYSLDAAISARYYAIYFLHKKYTAPVTIRLPNLSINPPCPGSKLL